MSSTNVDQTSPAAPAQDDETRRTAPRRRVLKSGMIAYNNRHSTLPCTVRNISATGAQLRMPGMAASAPDTFDLIIDLDGIEASCTVMWRRGDDIGVKFDREPTKVSPKRIQIVTAVAPAKPVSLRRKPR